MSPGVTFDYVQERTGAKVMPMVSGSGASRG
jgi:hypothetical protein